VDDPSSDWKNGYLAGARDAARRIAAERGHVPAPPMDSPEREAEVLAVLRESGALPDADDA
jgi:hypothetical protein